MSSCHRLRVSVWIQTASRWYSPSLLMCCINIHPRILIMATVQSRSSASPYFNFVSGHHHQESQKYRGELITLNNKLKISKLERPTVIVGLFLQQAIALFVLKTDAGFSIFKWIATLASDFLVQANAGSGFFFDADVISQHWFFVNTVRLNYTLIYAPKADHFP